MPGWLEKSIFCILVAVGVMVGVNLLAYLWEHLVARGMPILWLFLFVYFFVACIFQLFFVWYLYSRFKKRKIPEAPIGLSVDVFVAAYNEPMWIVERALQAARNINYSHVTYLLDDSPEGVYKDLAERLKTEYLTREGNLHFKAGNINSALERTSGELIAIFDIDHAPDPEFLDRTLGFFDDERIGFVQVMESFCNAEENLIAEASAQTAVEYFNITLTCKDQVGACSHHGSNAVIRRKALESIGGYRPGLAEDLETSIAIHSRGWKSAYVCEPLAPGLTPSSFQAFCKQQLKWSRGVFEAAWNSFREKSFFKLTWHQKLSYGVRFYYYIVGFSFFCGMSFTLLYLFRQDAVVYEGFLARLLSLSVISLLIRYVMLRACGTEPLARKGVHFKGASLVLSIWPIYVLSLICTLARIRIPFISTPKESGSGHIDLRTVLPQMIMFCALLTGVVWKVIHWNEGSAPLTVLFAMMLLGQHWMLFAVIWKSIREAFRNPMLNDIQPEMQVDRAGFRKTQSKRKKN